MADNPRGYWRCDEASGDPQDSSGNSWHMTDENGTPVYELDGPLDCANSIGFADANVYRSTIGGNMAALSIEFWLWITQLSTTTTTYVVGNSLLNIGGVNVIFDPAIPRQLAVVCEGVAVFQISGVTLPLDTWTHVVIVRDGGVWKSYLDGAIDNPAGPGTLPGAPTGGSTFFGADTSGSSIRLAHVAWYDAALSAARVAAHYAAAF